MATAQLLTLTHGVNDTVRVVRLYGQMEMK